MVILSEEIEDRSAKGIAAAVSRLVTSGMLAPGTRLPTVRVLAHDLGVSPTTVSQAWRRLAEAGIIEPRGKLGTRVRAEPAERKGRFVQLRHSQRESMLDLSAGVPDPALLPDLRPALAVIGRPAGPPLTNSYLDDPVLPALRDLVLEALPYKPPALTVVDGALDALDRTLDVVVRFGDRVLVEAQTFPPILDLLERRGAEGVGLAMDDFGIIPAALRDALDDKPTAIVIQPRAHNPTGRSMSPKRVQELARILRKSDVIVIEDDHAGDISVCPAVSLGTELAEQTVYVRSFSKSHGPDLRLAAIAGPVGIVEAILSRRQIGAGWSSRILQALLVELLTNERSVKQVAKAREVYAERRGLLIAALRERDITVSGDDGINIWVQVDDEQTALLTLGANGILAAPGDPFCVERTDEENIRITSGLVREDWDGVANVIATAATAATTRAYR